MTCSFIGEEGEKKQNSQLEEDWARLLRSFKGISGNPPANSPISLAWDSKGNRRKTPGGYLYPEQEMQDIKLCVLFAPDCFVVFFLNHQMQTWKEQSLSVNSGPFWVEAWQVVEGSFCFFLFFVLTINMRGERRKSPKGEVTTEGWSGGGAVAAGPVEKYLVRESSRITHVWCPAISIQECGSDCWRPHQRRNHAEESKGKSRWKCNTWLQLRASISKSASMSPVSAMWLALSGSMGRPGSRCRKLPVLKWGGGMAWDDPSNTVWLIKEGLWLRQMEFPVPPNFGSLGILPWL